MSNLILDEYVSGLNEFFMPSYRYDIACADEMFGSLFFAWIIASI
jgi:hypothetical protein